MKKLRLQDLDLKGKKVLVRVDFNAPLNKDGTVSDDTRLRESLPTIQYILNAGGAAILMSHLGRPKNREPEFSLKPCAEALSKLLGQEVQIVEDCVGKDVEKKVDALRSGEVLLLENLRFHPAEEKPSVDPSFAQKLAALGDVYVNDAFATAHRAHSSTATIASFFPGKAATGLLLQKEIDAFEHLLSQPKRPFYVIIGGSKISTKMGVLKSLLSKADGIFIGGGMAFTFYKAQGIAIGDSIHEDDQIPAALDFMNACSQKRVPLWLPVDLSIADAFNNEALSKTISASEGIPPGWRGMDIGPKTREEWERLLQKASTIFWNGPLGVFEFPHFAAGTRHIAQAIADLNAIKLVGGGDSVAAINQMGLTSKFNHVSTGGGASLEYIEFGHLPGIDALSCRKE